MGPCQEFSVEDGCNRALGSLLRRWIPGLSWSQVRRTILQRRVTINHVLCLDEARRLTPGEMVRVYSHAAPPPPADKDIAVLHADPHMMVVVKPSPMIAVRPPQERRWSQRRRDLWPTLDELLLRRFSPLGSSRSEHRLYPVHRIDRDTSGLLVFARTGAAYDHLTRQFAAHAVQREYWAIVPGRVDSQSIRSTLIRDRGDGLRGSTLGHPRDGQAAVTHVRPVRFLGDYSQLECILETGRTNQIRIHLAELGHPVCGDRKYRGPFGSCPRPDMSRAPRLALHACRLAFRHPENGQDMEFSSPWPADLQRFIEQLAGTNAE